MQKSLFILLFSSLLAAAELDELLANTKANEKILALSLEVDSRMQKAQNIKASYLPSVDFDASYARFDLDKLIILPEQRMSAGISAKWLLYDAGKNSNIKMAAKNHELGKIELERAENELEFQLVNLYYTYLALQKNQEFIKQKITHLQAVCDQLESFVAAGLKSRSELDVFHSHLAAESTQVLQVAQQLEDISNMIFLLSGKEISTNKKFSLKLADTSRQKDYESRINEAKYQLAALNLDSKKAEFYPQIFAYDALSYSHSSYKFDDFGMFAPLAKAAVKENAISNTFLLGFKLNLYSFGAMSAKNEEARLKKMAAAKMLEFSKKQNKIELKTLKNSLILLNEQLGAAKEQVLASKKAFDSINKQYLAGILSYTEFLDALQNNYAAWANYAMLESKKEIQKAKILLKSGEKISKNLSEN